MSKYLYRDYETNGTKYPIDNNLLYEQEDETTANEIKEIRQRVATMEADTAAALFICSEDEEEFHERLFTIQRMNGDDAYAG